MSCDGKIARRVVAGGAVDPGTQSHIDRCLRCQAVLARQERVRRLLVGLRDHTSNPDHGLLEEILSGLDDSSATAGRGGRVYAVLCATAATAATVGTVGAIVVANRARTRRIAS